MLTRILIDIETGMSVTDAEIITPLANRLFAPFLDFPSYFLTMPHPEAQLLSWLVWLCIIWIAFSYFRLKEPLSKRILPLIRGVLVIAVSFILFVIYCILCPLPQNRMTSTNPDEVFLDLHSHTIYSHDGIVTPERSLRWHINAGFEGWATTEHDWIGDAPSIQKELIKKKSLAAVAIAGQEINFKRVHLNLLGIKEDFDVGKHKNLAGLIEDVHRQGGAVIVPHYWAETKSPFSMKELADAGVDGFEIAGNASIPLTHKQQREIIALCKNEGLVPLSGSNWHGWRNSCTVWTGFTEPNWKQMNIEARERAVIEALRNRETGRFRVIGYKQRFYAEPDYLLEPFTGFFFHFTSLDTPQQVSWLLWIAAFYFLLRRMKNRRLIAIMLWETVTIALFVKAIFVFNAWKTVADVNKILPDIGKILLTLAVLTSLLSLSNLLKKKHGF